ncbi:MAG: phosphate transport system substrate-binding protein [Acidobacteriota bacterium]|nr:phosphate transport system substrate-binding protein [Acidobacteriota bacterium]
MKLAGDLAEFSLPDLLQIKSAGRQTAGLRILGPEGNGLIVLKDGEVIHSQYEDLAGERAFHALMAVKAGYFEAVELAEGQHQSITKPVRQLLLDSHQLAESGKLPKPVRRATLPGVTLPTSEVRTVGRSSARPRLGVVTLVIAAVVLAGVTFAILQPRREVGAGAPATGGAAVAERFVEATELTGPGDRLPELLAGAKPVLPPGDSAVVPTIICRLQIGAQGKVLAAKVYRSRLEFAAFEESAMKAVETYRFQPALDAGQPVGVWINLPVDFQ